MRPSCGPSPPPHDADEPPGSGDVSSTPGRRGLIAAVAEADAEAQRSHREEVTPALSMFSRFIPPALKLAPRAPTVTPPTHTRTHSHTYTAPAPTHF